MVRKLYARMKRHQDISRKIICLRPSLLTTVDPELTSVLETKLLKDFKLENLISADNIVDGFSLLG